MRSRSRALAQRGATAAGVEYVATLPALDLIFHLAGTSGIEESLEDPSRDLQANTLGTLEVLEAARRMPGARVVVAASAAVYGPSEGLVSEEQPPHPISPYGVSKLAAEGYVRSYSYLHGIEGLIARIGNPYGPGQRKRVVYDLAWRALHEPPPLRLPGSGSAVRDFVHASDVASALIAIAPRGAPGETYNVGSGRAVTLREVAELVAHAAGLPDSAVRPDDAPTPGKVDEFRPSIDKLARLGYQAVVTLECGIEETVAWVKST